MAEIKKIKLGGTSYDVRDAGATRTTVMPNDNGEIKTKYRIAKKGDAGRTAGAYWYYKICELPINNSGNYASAIISGRIGGWTSGDMSYINALIWNRDTPGIALIDIGGSAASMSSIWSICDLVLYKNGTGSATNEAVTATLYAKCYSWFLFDLDLEVFQQTAKITYDGNYITTTPSGTLVAQASTSTKRLELVNEELYVAGTKMPKADTWRGIQNNLTSDSTTDSLSAKQGKVLKGLVDSKTTLAEVEDYIEDNSEEVDLGTYFTKSDVNTLINQLFTFEGTTLIIKDQ